MFRLIFLSLIVLSGCTTAPFVRDPKSCPYGCTPYEVSQYLKTNKYAMEWEKNGIVSDDTAIVDLEVSKDGRRIKGTIR